MPTNIFLKNSNRVKRLSKIKSAVITMAIVGNPVVLSQWLVYYIDFYKYIYLILELLSFYLISRYDRNQRRMGYIILGMSLILAMGTKFNFFFEAGLSMVLAFIWLGIKKNYEVLRRLVIVSICALGIGSILAYHPYITNYLGNGHPLYPLMGDGAIDIMTGNTPEKYLHSDRVTNFFKSLFSVSIPNYDQRNGGFSVFMPILLFLSVIIAWKVRRYLNAVIWYIAGSIFLSCFIFEQTWWARYICQLWLWCGIFLIASQCVTYTKKLGCCMLVIMIIAGVLTICTSVSISVIRGSYLRYLFQACREAPVKVVGDLPIQIRRHLEEEEIKYIIIDSVPDNENINAVYYYYGCSPVIILSSDQIRHIDDNLKRLHQTVDRYRYVPMNLEEYGKTNEKEENSSF